MKLTTQIITPDCNGFAQLKAESMASGLNMLRRLDENWLNNTNRFDRPGEKLLGTFYDGVLIAVGGVNRDPFTADARAGRIRHLYVGNRWRRQHIGQNLLREIVQDASQAFDFLNTCAPLSAYAFYEQAGFGRVTDSEKVTHRLTLR